MASTSKQLIACMSKAKGDAKKIAACKASFAGKIKILMNLEYGVIIYEKVLYINQLVKIV